MNKKKLIKKSKKIIKNFFLMLFTSGVIVVLIELWHSDAITEPKTWIKIDSLKEMSSTDFSCPSEININYNNYFSNIFGNSFIIDLHIKNSSENEVVLSDLKFKMLQYQCDFPIISVEKYIENNNFMIDITNLSNQKIKDLDVHLYDNEGVLQELFDRKLNILLQEINAGETKRIIFFNIDDIIGREVDSWSLNPYVSVSDSKGNALFFNLGWFSLNDNEYRNHFEDCRNIIQYFLLYDITPDIIIDNEEINLKEVVEYIPAHEVLNLKLLITSEVPCAFDLQVYYKLDNKEHMEEEMSFVIYNPYNMDNKYEVTDEYIEIKKDF